MFRSTRECVIIDSFMTIVKRSLEEAAEADSREWRAMTPAERLDLVQRLRDLYYEFKNEDRKGKSLSDR